MFNYVYTVLALFAYANPVDDGAGSVCPLEFSSEVAGKKIGIIEMVADFGDYEQFFCLYGPSSSVPCESKVTFHIYGKTEDFDPIFHLNSSDVSGCLTIKELERESNAKVNRINNSHYQVTLPCETLSIRAIYEGSYSRLAIHKPRENCTLLKPSESEKPSATTPNPMLSSHMPTSSNPSTETSKGDHTIIIATCTVIAAVIIVVLIAAVIMYCKKAHRPKKPIQVDTSSTNLEEDQLQETNMATNSDSSSRISPYGMSVEREGAVVTPTEESHQ